MLNVRNKRTSTFEVRECDDMWTSTRLRYRFQVQLAFKTMTEWSKQYLNVLSIIITLTFKRHLKCKEATDQHRQMFNCLGIPDFYVHCIALASGTT